MRGIIGAKSAGPRKVGKTETGIRAGGVFRNSDDVIKKVITGVLVIAGGLFSILLLITVWHLKSRAAAAKRLRVESDQVSFAAALKMYVVNNGRPPTTEQGFGALVDKPRTGPEPKRWSRIMDRVPVDPWQTPYRYLLLPPKGTQWRCELRSAGPDGVFGNGDDLAEVTEWGKAVDQAAEGGEKANSHLSY
jgi:general secretion pathway protein G